MYEYESCFFLLYCNSLNEDAPLRILLLMLHIHSMIHILSTLFLCLASAYPFLNIIWYYCVFASFLLSQILTPWSGSLSSSPRVDRAYLDDKKELRCARSLVETEQIVLRVPAYSIFGTRLLDHQWYVFFTRYLNDLFVDGVITVLYWRGLNVLFIIIIIRLLLPVRRINFRSFLA